MNAVHGPVVLFGCRLFGCNSATREHASIVGLHGLAYGQDKIADRIMNLERLDGPMLVLKGIRDGHGLLTRLFGNFHQMLMSLVISRKARRCFEISNPRSPTKLHQRLPGRAVGHVSRRNKSPVGRGVRNLTWCIVLDWRGRNGRDIFLVVSEMSRNARFVGGLIRHDGWSLVGMRRRGENIEGDARMSKEEYVVEPKFYDGHMERNYTIYSHAKASFPRLCKQGFLPETPQEPTHNGL